VDFLSSVFAWLSEREAGISAVVGIAVLAGIVFAGVRSLVRRRGEATAEKAPASSAETAPATDSTSADLDPLTVPGFEGRPAIAVLPFDNLSGDPDQEYFADGIAEDLITRLSSWREFPVIARNSSFTYKGKAVDVKQVSRELGVHYVVEGSVRKVGDRVRISAQLIDATTGHHVWAETYDRELQDIFELQDEITQAIVASMFTELERFEWERVARQPPQNLDAYDCTQRGWWYFLKQTKEDMTKARSLFERAIELDPRYLEGFHGLGVTHYMDLINLWTDSPDESIAKLTEAARTCVALDEKNAFGQLGLGYTYRITGEAEKAIAALKLAIELNPSLTTAYHELGISLALLGRPDEAIANSEKAMRLSPHDPLMWLFLSGVALAYAVAGRHEEAVEWSQRSLQRKSDWFLSHLVLAYSYASLGRAEAARGAIDELLRHSPDVSLSGLKLLLSTAEPAFAERALDGLRKAGLPE
jgi:TolB-like protein/predicted Zn-dependent protease